MPRLYKISFLTNYFIFLLINFYIIENFKTEGDKLRGTFSITYVICRRNYKLKTMQVLLLIYNWKM